MRKIGKKKKKLNKKSADLDQEITELKPPSSESKRVEKTLVESARMYRTLVESLQEGIAILDPDENIIFANDYFCKTFNYLKEEIIGMNLQEIVPKEEFKKVLQETAKRRNSITSKYELIIKRKDGKMRYIIVSTAPWVNDKGEFQGTFEGILDITDYKRTQEKLRKSLEKTIKILNSTTYAITHVLEARDPYTAGHQQRVTQLACAIAKDMALPDELVEGIRIAGLLHDIGKIAIPAEILGKPSGLTKDESNIIKNHPQVGYDILKTIEFPWPIARIILQHHERMDGSGYPAGLSGEEIMVEARILAISDVVEAMIYHRPYRPARGILEALQEISQNKNGCYDPEVVDVCVTLFTEKGFKFSNIDE